MKGSGSRSERRAAGMKSNVKVDAQDWRIKTLAKVRHMIKEADPGVSEEQKWRKPSNPDGIPVWSHDGIICTGETYKEHVKLTFGRGASLKDPTKLFNGNLGGKTTRSIDIHQGDRIDETAFKNLIREAVALNMSGTKH